MTPEERKKAIRSYYAALDAGDFAAAGAFLAPGYRYHGENHTGVDDYRPGVQAKVFYAAFPDFFHAVEDQIADGDVVVNRIRYFATHLGEFMGIPATGRKVTWTGIDYSRFEGDEVVERWGVYDALDLKRQLEGLPDTKETETYKALARGYYDAIDRYGITSQVGKPYHGPGYTFHAANHTGFDDIAPGSRGAAFFAAFPDYTHVIEDQIAEGDVVVERIRYHATHRGTFMGVPATGRRITYTGMDWVRFEDGRIVERRGVADSLELRRQLLGEAP